MAFRNSHMSLSCANAAIQMQEKDNWRYDISRIYIAIQNV